MVNHLLGGSIGIASDSTDFKYSYFLITVIVSSKIAWRTLYAIKTGELRGDEPMQVVSGRIDKPTVHFEAPPREVLERELAAFINWFNQSLQDPTLDPLLRAAICHFWFVTIHPFDDGNGRITRVLTDLALAQEDKQSIRLYAMSASILTHRTDYYRVLEESQRHTTDITSWLLWFLQTLENSMQTAINKIDQTLAKSRFWQHSMIWSFLKSRLRSLTACWMLGIKALNKGLMPHNIRRSIRLARPPLPGI